MQSQGMAEENKGKRLKKVAGGRKNAKHKGRVRKKGAIWRGKDMTRKDDTNRKKQESRGTKHRQQE